MDSKSFRFIATIGLRTDYLQRILGKFRDSLVCHLQSMLIFSILNHPRFGSFLPHSLFISLNLPACGAVYN